LLDYLSTLAFVGANVLDSSEFGDYEACWICKVEYANKSGYIFGPFDVNLFDALLLLSRMYNKLELEEKLKNTMIWKTDEPNIKEWIANA
jgi:hypothetical protein